jgi:hypothetical protein
VRVDNVNGEHVTHCNMARRKRTSSALAKLTRDPAGVALVVMATPILIGGAVALGMALAGRKSSVASWLKSLFGAVAGAGSRTLAMRDALGHFIHGNGPFAALRDAVIGAGKGAVISVFGPPRTAMLGRGARLSIWRSDTWYYPLDQTDRSALAIRFQGNVARDVERISVPEVSID